MKLNRILCLVLTAALSVFFCGCDADNIPDDMQYQLVDFMYCINNTDLTTFVKVSKEHKKFAESCFDDIELYGAKLSLPMKLSDLPDEFVYVPNKSPSGEYNGMYSHWGNIDIDDTKVCTAEIIYPVGKDYKEGVIVSLGFSHFPQIQCATFRMGGEYGFLSMSKAEELLGEFEDINEVIYYLGDDRVISLYYSDSYGTYDPEGCALAVTISTVGDYY